MTPTQAAHPEERIPSSEAADIAVINRISEAILDRNRRPVRRGQHSKQHGCVRAEFIVEPNLPEDLKLGVLRTTRTYPAWIRFSNGSQDDDGYGDIHGMAIKLMDVDGPKILDDERNERTQDFVLMDHPAFFSRHAHSNRALAEVMARSSGPSLVRRLMYFARTERQIRSAYIALHHFILGLRFHEFRVLRAAVSKMPLSPLEIPYWSATPYALGKEAVKYSAIPRPIRPPGVLERSDRTAPDRLRAAMTAHLDRAEARFDFLVQVRTAARKKAMPVEDASIDWGKNAPFRKVATIVIPPQTFDTPARMTFCENLSFTPWHSLPEHRPIGGINRARKVVYEAISKVRHHCNAMPRREPDPQFMP